MTRLAALAVCVLLVASACGGSGKTHGGSGVVTASRVGPLVLDSATRAQVVAFAGKPDLVDTSRKSYVSLGYGCARGARSLGIFACKTIYQVSYGKAGLFAFATKSPNFETARGTRPGMTLKEAMRRERSSAFNDTLNFVRQSTVGSLTFDLGCPGDQVSALVLESRAYGTGIFSRPYIPWWLGCFGE